MIHELKIWPQYYAPVKAGLKTFEVRKNDRGFNAGDGVTLHEYDPEAEKVGRSGYTGSEPLEFKIGYVLPIDAERVVFSLLPKDPA